MLVIYRMVQTLVRSRSTVNFCLLYTKNNKFKLFLPDKTSKIEYEISLISKQFKRIKMCESGVPEIDKEENKYPYCIVWRPIRGLTWIVPFLGHLGIAMSNGVIRDFAKSYQVKLDDFDKPAKYLQLSPFKVEGGASVWDAAIENSSENYEKQRLHPPFFDNCYSYVGYALNTMKYDGNDSYHMGWRCIWIFWKAKYNGFYGFVWTWLPFFVFWTSTMLLVWLFYGDNVIELFQ